MKNNKHYGLPKLRKYPMPDKKHVKSAIRFFNYVSPANEKELAKAIFKRMRKYGMSFSDFAVGEENRFIKYVPKKYLSHSEDQNMYSNNDFRYYKGGEYLAHYGVKGMKWHKHLKAATDWWKYDVTGSGYKQDAQTAQTKADALHKRSQRAFTSYQKTGRKTDLDTAAKYARRSNNYSNIALANEKLAKNRDVKGQLKKAVSTKARNAKLFIDSRITGSTARNEAAKQGREYSYYQRKSASSSGTAARFQKHSSNPSHGRKMANEFRRDAAMYNKEAVSALNKRNKAQSEYEKSLRGKAEKKLNKIFKRRKKREKRYYYW